MKGFVKLAFFSLFCFAFLFFVTPMVVAEGETPPPCTGEGCPPPEPPPCIPGPVTTSTSTSGPFECNVNTVFSCMNNACGKDGGAIQRATESFTCETITESWTNGCDGGSSSNTSVIGGPLYKDSGHFSSAGKYQICPVSANNWSPAPPPAYECSGQCYPAPEVKKLDDKSLAPKNVLENSKAKLPVTFGWKDNVEDAVAEDSCVVDNYQYQINGGPVPASGVVTPPIRNVIVSPGECTLTSGIETYVFSARACVNGTCGAQGTLPFATSTAPQLLSPYDNDWQGNEKSGAVTSPNAPLVLEWCPITKVQDKKTLSYKVQVTFLEDGKEQCHPSGTVGGGSTSCPSFLLTPTIGKTESGARKEELLAVFRDMRGAFTKGTQYFWSVAACIFRSGADCTTLSQKWSFEPIDFPIEETMLTNPPNDPTGTLDPIGFPVVLSWTKPFGINSFQYEIVPVTPDAKAPQSPGVAKFIPQSKPYEPTELSLNALYAWRVKPCIDTKAQNCQDQWTKEWTFRTTGAPPQDLEERNRDEKGEVIIPAVFTWQGDEGAKSYRYQVSASPSFPQNESGELALANEASVDYPILRMNTNYWWHVKTCADREGKFCGLWSSVQGKQFHTFTLKNPVSPKVPQDKGELFTYQGTLSWDPIPGAKAYQYTLLYTIGNPPTDEKDPPCPSFAGKEVALSITQSPFIQPEFTCLGNYEWKVVSCLDSVCNEKSPVSVSPWTFRYVQPPPPNLPGLLVCGRLSDHPDTNWRELDKCEFRHIFLLLRNLIDFALWKLSLAIVIVMVIVTGAIMFFSFGGTEVLVKVKSIWKSVGIGVLILLFAWVFLNILLALVGFNINFYGHWYELPFR